MFRSLMLFATAAVLSQPIAAHAGDLNKTQKTFSMPNLNLPATTLPLMFAPRIPVVTFPHTHHNVTGFPQSNFPHANLPQIKLPQNNLSQFGDRRFKHFETYSKWTNNRRLLGNPVGF